MENRMRRCLAALALTLSALCAFADIDPTVARIRLTKVEVITRKQLESQIEKFEKAAGIPLSSEDKRKLLDNMIDSKLLL